jgi:hypothetical protein
MTYKNSIRLVLFMAALTGLLTACSAMGQILDVGQDYFVDSGSGDDVNSGTSEGSPWQSLDKVASTIFEPGDSIYFKRGSSYEGGVAINGDGTERRPITVSAYGSGDAPRLTNPSRLDHNGNIMQIRGDYQIVENLYFHHAAPATMGTGSFANIWAIGAVHVDLGSDYAIIRDNEFANNPKAIQSYSEYSLITRNYIHGVNDEQSNGWLSLPYWGPIGIQIGIGNQEISYNRIEDMYKEGGEWGGDGGAIEIDDGRNHKDNIHIHHNTTVHNMGFLEISYWEDIEKMASSNIVIEYNVSRDYQSFVFWWAPTTGSAIQNNTIIRTDNEFAGPFDGVFFIDAPPGDIRLTQNIIVTDNDLTEAIFMEGFDGGVFDVVHTDNIFWDVADGVVDLGLPFGPGELQADPLFVDWQAGDYRLLPDSLASGWGALDE